MKKVRFTDEHRYPHGYRASNQTDVSATFARIRREMEAKRKATDAKVAHLKRSA